VNGDGEYRPLETLTVAVPDSMYLLLRAYSAHTHLSESSIVESALETFLDIVERCDPEARAAARRLSEQE
jgi:hypothetical protein